MRRSQAVPFAAAGTLFLIILDAFGHWSANSGSWFTEPASPTLIKTCIVIAVLYYAGWIAFVGLARYRQAAEDERELKRVERAPVIPLPNRRPHNPPTQPIPVPPGDTITINE